jgi:hypothetical protein
MSLLTSAICRGAVIPVSAITRNVPVRKGVIKGADRKGSSGVVKSVFRRGPTLNQTSFNLGEDGR